ncbi:asparaginase [Candidatus Paracaedibacter symbiosus]|uniref:asparaginase n=1 Tax=Candidatus Paracaedibacter symbiosus TaxID=244582 RepID=UPI000509B515|nr:asparaginase [Candidatus Paracaedibacter symbiosus]
MNTNPVLVNLIRGDLVENSYRGSYVVVDSEGDLITATGHFRQTIYPRSSLKPIQVLAMLESGAADQYKVSLQEIALACASHNGEEQHVEVVHAWLNRLDLTQGDLECGLHAPMGRESAKALAARGEKPTTLHNACSGKHAGFLTLAKFLEAPLKGYTDFNHSTQQKVNELIAEMTGTDVDLAPKGFDGCQIPVIGMELQGLAMAMAKLVDPKNMRESLQRSCARVVEAMQQYPHLIAGTGRFCTDIIEKTGGEVLVKMGADGVFSAAIPKRKWGIALKIDDGNLKAAEVALMSLLSRLQLISNIADFTNYLEFPINNWNRQIVGKIRSAI